MVGVMFTLLLLLGCQGCRSTPETSEPSAIIMVLDGVRTEEFTSTWLSDITGQSGEDFAANVWDNLMPDATVVRTAYNPGVTITAPGHATLLTGHQEAFANFPVTDGDVGLYQTVYPTVFEEAYSQLALSEADMPFVANTELLQPLTRSLYPGGGAGGAYHVILEPDGSGAPATDDNLVIDKIKTIFAEEPPRLMVVNLHDADRGGHYGTETEYPNDVAKQDRILSDFWDWLNKEQPEYTENLLWILVADHGRHRHEEDSGWRNHGDACTGCREVWMVLAGGAVNPGLALDGYYTHSDVTATVAAHLGIELPWGEGMAITEAIAGLNNVAPAGEVDVSASGGLVGVRRWTGDRDARSEVVVDDTVLSTPGIVQAEGPVVLDGETRDYACFRELDLDPDADFWPWIERCLVDDGTGWEEIGFPDAEVSTFFRPALQEVDGVLYAAWGYNPDGIGESGQDNIVGIRHSTWTPETGWSAPLRLSALYPTDPALLRVSGSTLVAAAVNLDPPDARYTRRVRLWRASGSLTEITEFTLPELLSGSVRVERPALGASDGVIRLAMLGMDLTQTVLAVVESADNGATWSAPVSLPLQGTPLPHLSPQWMGAELVWAAADPADEDASFQLCRAAVDATAATCIPAGGRVDSFSVVDDRVVASVDDGAGTWTTVSLSW